MIASRTGPAGDPCASTKISITGAAQRAPPPRRAAPRGSSCWASTSSNVALRSASRPRLALPAGRSRPSSSRRASKELRQRASALPPSRNHQTLAPPELVLDPCPASTPLRVDRVQPLGHDPLEALLGDRGHDAIRVADEITRSPAHRPIKPQLSKQLATAGVGETPHRAAVQVQDVERHERRRASGTIDSAGGARQAGSQRAEVRPAVVVQNTSSPSRITDRPPTAFAISASSGN